MTWALGPLNGARLAGSGTFCVVSKGPTTNLAGSSQTNGFFRAFLKLNGFDGIVVDGATSGAHLFQSKWVVRRQRGNSRSFLRRVRSRLEVQ